MKSRRVLLLVLCLIQMGFVPTLLAQATIQPIRTHGPTSTYINLVYLSEGYTASQLPQFLVDVTNTVNKLLTIPPWSSYSNYFNVFAISVASVQSGSDHYTPTTNLVNTYFNSTFDSYGTQRLLTIPPNDRDGNYNDGYGKVDALLQQLLPEYDIAGLIVNDTVYGGSGGQYLLASVNSSSGEIANHEIGHTFAQLGDEYSTAFPGYPDVEEPNTTTNATHSVKWNDWILPTTLVPTPDVASNNTVVGVFEGAHYHTTGWYRPKHDCKMRTLGVPYCEVCAQELVLSMYRVIRPIQNFLPASSNVTLEVQGSASFNISILKPATNNLTVQWFTNGVAVGLATATNFTINASQLAVGANTIKVLVHDPTSYVRADPANRLWDTNVWNLAVIVAPTIINPQLTGTTFTLSVPTQAGFNYILESKNLLTDPNWTPVQTNNGNGGLITLTNPGVSGPSRFYHIRVQ
jgi:IgA Peptidase M64